jgi:hypothetical protein
VNSTTGAASIAASTGSFPSRAGFLAELVLMGSAYNRGGSMATDRAALTIWGPRPANALVRVHARRSQPHERRTQDEDLWAAREERRRISRVRRRARKAKSHRRHDEKQAPICRRERADDAPSRGDRPAVNSHGRRPFNVTWLCRERATERSEGARPSASKRMFGGSFSSMNREHSHAM